MDVQGKGNAGGHSGSSQLNEIIHTLLTDTHLKGRKREERNRERKYLIMDFGCNIDKTRITKQKSWEGNYCECLRGVVQSGSASSWV